MDAAAVRTDTWLGFHVFKLWFWFQFHSDWVTVAFGHTEMKWTSLKFDSELCCTRTTHTHKLVFRPVSVNSTFCLCSMCAPTYGLWIKLRVCVVLMHFCACVQEKHIFPHCQHHSRGLLLFKRWGQRSLLFFSLSWPASLLSCSLLNWTLTECQKARGCMLPASAFQETKVFVQWVSKSLEMSSTVLQNPNSSII